MGDEEQEEDWQTKIMKDGLPHVDPELWGEEGALLRGVSMGNIIDSASDGVTIQRGEKVIIFRRPKQTQVVYFIVDGVEQTAAYDLSIHGELKDIPLMEMSPSELRDQLEKDGGTQLTPSAQTFSNTLKKGTSHGRWPANRHPKPISGQ